MTTLLVSDLHLDAAEPAGCSDFVQFLATRAVTASALYILGDLFEFTIGDDAPDAARTRICQALAGLAARQIPVYFMHGNRDFLLGSDFSRSAGAYLLDDPVTLESPGGNILLTHGDALCTDDTSYQRLRSVVRQPRWQRRFLGLPLATRAALAARARAGSRRHTQSSDYRIMDVNPAVVERAMRSCGVRTLIHGHTHRPAIHTFTLDGSPAHRVVLGAWHDGGSCVSIDGRELRLEQWQRGQAPRILDQVLIGDGSPE